MSQPHWGPQEHEIMQFLHERVFNPVLSSPQAPENLKQGIRYTIMRMSERDADQMRQYFWSAVIGTQRSIGFSAQMQRAGFDRFEEALDEFRRRFDRPTRYR